MSTSEHLPLPQTLSNLIESGFWPTTAAEALAQNSKSLVPRDKIKAFAPEENYIYFLAPPFATVSSLRRSGETFWDWPMAAAHELDADKTVVIGDFGNGPDAPIALDYKREINNPSVIRLQWSKEGNHWVEIAANFVDFVKLILD